MDSVVSVVSVSSKTTSCCDNSTRSSLVRWNAINNVDSLVDTSVPVKMWLSTLSHVLLGMMAIRVTHHFSLIRSTAGCFTTILAFTVVAIPDIVFVSALEETQPPSTMPIETDGFRWTPLTIAQAIIIFVLSGFAEIGGGWMVWKAIREGKPWWWALLGSFVMVLYAFLPTLQPTDSFGRIYAVYGGFFIGLSYVWGWILDGMKPDMGDIVGGTIAVIAVLFIQYWPRQQ